MREVSTLFKAMLPPIIEQLMKDKAFTPMQLKAVSEKCIAYGHEWGFICFSIGIENGNGHIQENKVPEYLFALNRALCDHLNDYLVYLVLKKIVNQDRATNMAKLINSALSKSSLNLVQAGWLQHSAIKTSESTPFLTALREIEI